MITILAQSMIDVKMDNALEIQEFAFPMETVANFPFALVKLEVALSLDSAMYPAMLIIIAALKMILVLQENAELEDLFLALSTINAKPLFVMHQLDLAVFPFSTELNATIEINVPREIFVTKMDCALEKLILTS